MSLKVHIKPLRYKYPQEFIVAEVNGNTVGDCFDHLTKQFPGIEQDLFGKDGKLFSHISIFVNGESAYPEDLTRPVKDGDDIYIIPMIAGG